MKQLDFERAKTYALTRLVEDIPGTRVYHSITHTRDEVAPAVEQLAIMENVGGEELSLLRTAVYFHDLGFVESNCDHELIGARIASEVLPGFGYQAGQIQTIQNLILATRLPQSPKTYLEEILADADLVILGKDTFMERNQDLRAEMANYGEQVMDDIWFGKQLSFLSSHTYFTSEAHSLLDAGKEKNIARLKEFISYDIREDNKHKLPLPFGAKSAEALGAGKVDEDC